MSKNKSQNKGKKGYSTSKSVLTTLLLTGVICTSALSAQVQAFANPLDDYYNNQSTTVTEPTYYANTGVYFSDLQSSKDHWAYDTIMKLANEGIIKGYTEDGVTAFKANKDISRAEYLKLVMSSTQDGKQYTQGNSAYWFSPVLADARDKGVILTVDNWQETNEFMNKPITRYEMAKVLTRADTSILGTANVSTSGVENIIRDYDNIPSSDKPYVEQAYMRGLLTGRSDGSYDGTNTTKRGESAVSIDRLINKSERLEVDTTKPLPELPKPEILTNRNTNNVYSDKQRRTLSVEYAEPLCLETIKSTRVYQENGKYYVSIDLAELPKVDGVELKWQPVVSVYSKDNTILYDLMSNKSFGNTGHQVYELTGVTQKDVQNGATIQISCQVASNETTGGTIYLKVGSRIPNTLIRSEESQKDNTTSTLDTSAIFAGWK